MDSMLIYILIYSRRIWLVIWSWGGAMIILKSFPVSTHFRNSFNYFRQSQLKVVLSKKKVLTRRHLHIKKNTKVFPLESEIACWDAYFYLVLRKIFCLFYYHHSTPSRNKHKIVHKIKTLSSIEPRPFTTQCSILTNTASHCCRNQRNFSIYTHFDQALSLSVEPVRNMLPGSHGKPIFNETYQPHG